MAKRTQHTIGLDIGTSRVTCIAGEPAKVDCSKSLALVKRKPRVAKRVIVNPDAAVDAIKKALKKQSE
jgi:cell division ATPase FtsA